MPKQDAKDPIQEELERQILEGAPEICIWMIVFGCLTTMAEIREDYASSNIDHSVFYPAFNQAYAELIKAANATDRFGLILPVTTEPNFRKRIERDPFHVISAEFSSFFWKWYNWWADHLFGVDEVARQRLFQLGQSRSAELVEYKPPGDWMHYRQTAPKVLNFSVPPGVAKAE